MGVTAAEGAALSEAAAAAVAAVATLQFCSNAISSVEIALLELDAISDTLVMLRLAVLACALLSAADASVRPAMSPALKLRGGAGPLVSAPKAPTALTDLKGGQVGGIDWQLLFYFAAWYLGNYYYLSLIHI